MRGPTIFLSLLMIIGTTLSGCTGVLGSSETYSLAQAGTATTNLDTLAVILLEDADEDLRIGSGYLHIEVCVIDPNNPKGPSGGISCGASGIGCEGAPGESCTISDSNSDGFWSVGEELAIIETTDICSDDDCEELRIDINYDPSGNGQGQHTTSLFVTMS